MSDLKSLIDFRPEEVAELVKDDSVKTDSKELALYLLYELCYADSRFAELDEKVARPMIRNDCAENQQAEQAQGASAT